MPEDHQSFRTRVGTFAAAVLICAIGILGLIWSDWLPTSREGRQAHSTVPYLVGDSTRYRAIAEGRLGEIESPFSRRVLYPWMAAGLACAAHLPLPTSFLDLNMGCFILLAFSLAAIMHKLRANPWFLVLCFLTPLPLESLQTAYDPDLCHMALLALFFLCVAYERDYGASAVLLAAFLVRESTLLLCLTTVVLGWRKRRKALVIGSVVVAVAGTAAGSAIARLGLPNLNHLPEWLYMVVRVPHEFLANILGLILETNVYRIHQAQWEWTVPPRWRIGLIREVYLTFSWQQACRTLAILLSVFGCAPVIARWAWKKAEPLADWDLTLQIAFCYGLLSYLLGTVLGAALHRLIGYGWPLFWLWLPCLLARINPAIAASRVFLLAACSLIAAWCPHLAGVRDLAPRYNLWLLFLPAMQLATWFLLTKAENFAERVPAAL